MSLKKCRKFVRGTEGFNRNLPLIHRQPIVLSDSKASYLKDVASSIIESEIEWWYSPGWDTNSGRLYLLSKIEEAILTYGRLHLYVWLGTCNLTVKPRKYVFLNPRHHRQESSSLDGSFRNPFTEIPERLPVQPI